MSTIEVRLKRAQDAENFLGEPYVKLIIQQETERLFKLWADSQPDQHDKRELIYAEYRGLLRIINTFREYVEDGKIIAKRVEDAAR